MCRGYCVISCCSCTVWYSSRIAVTITFERFWNDDSICHTAIISPLIFLWFELTWLPLTWFEFGCSTGNHSIQTYFWDWQCVGKWPLACIVHFLQLLTSLFHLPTSVLLFPLPPLPSPSLPLVSQDRTEDGTFVCYPHKIGKSTLVCGRRSSHFPYHIFVRSLELVLRCGMQY